MSTSEDDWRAQAACRGAPPDLFFPGRGDGRCATAQARRFCDGCPVSEECLEHGTRHEEFGIWGGRSGMELRRRRRALGIALETPAAASLVGHLLRMRVKSTG